jgi:predicted carbohydrate-binding protein with CBM5 and CBM33 domain
VSTVQLNSTARIHEWTGYCQIAKCQIANCQIANCQIANCQIAIVKSGSIPFVRRNENSFANHSGNPKSVFRFDPETRRVSGS